MIGTTLAHYRITGELFFWREAELEVDLIGTELERSAEQGNGS